MAIQVGLGLDSSVLAILVLIGVIEYWHVAVLSLLDGMLFSFSLPARLAIVPEIVSKEDFFNANSLYFVAMNLMSTIGPGLGGVFVASIGSAGVFFIVGAFYWAVAVILLMIRVSEMVVLRPEASVSKDIMGMFSFARHTPIILVLMGMTVAQTFFIGGPAGPQTFMPIFAVDILGVGAMGLGLLGAAAGLGALVGSLFVTFLGDFKRKTLLLLGSGVVQGALLFFFASSSIFYLSLFLVALSGIARAVYMSVNVLLYQLSATEEMRARIMSLYMVGTLGLQPLGVLPMSILVVALGAPFAIGIGGALFLAFCVIVSVLQPKFTRLSL